MERVLPKTIDYTDVLPLAVESKARRRTFFPVNGQSFTASGANIIRIDISADALLDTQHSYLRFTWTNDAAKTCGLDQAGGHAFIRRLRIEQSGTILEDINSYNRLMGAVVLPCQSGYDHAGERGITEGVGQRNGSNTLVTSMTGINNAGIEGSRAGGFKTQAHDYIPVSGAAADGSSVDMCIPLNSGIFNNEKLIPLMLMSAPLTIEIELAPVNEPVCFVDTAATDYTISNVRYIANLVEVGQDVAQQLRMVQEMSGGVLTLAGQTYRHFTGAVTAGTGDQIINVPARVKSMKSLFFVSQATAGNAQNRYNVSVGGNMKLHEYQLKIGSVTYPPTPVRCGFGDGTISNVVAKRAEPLMELAKAWGSVGGTKGMGQLFNQTYGKTEDAAVAQGAQVSYCPFGLDLEAFQRVAIESGVNTADRSLPISLILNYAQAPSACNVDVFVLADALFYINADGSMSVSV
tara:strand:- start:1195 stop:2583 length:1389 start_codon:yes stop_codon:yes gene_type:complete